MGQRLFAAPVDETLDQFLARYLRKTALRSIVWFGAAYALTRGDPAARWPWYVALGFLGVALAFALAVKLLADRAAAGKAPPGWVARLARLVDDADADSSHADSSHADSSNRAGSGVRRTPLKDANATGTLAGTTDGSPLDDPSAEESMELETPLVKLSRPDEDGYHPVVWPHVFTLQDAGGVPRLAIAPREDPLGLLLDLAATFGPTYRLLVVLAPTGPGRGEPGRYGSPPLALEHVRRFVTEFGTLLEHDARQELWISDGETQGLLVYDDHGIVYAYGPLDAMRRVLEARGLTPGTFDIPSPHAHHVHAVHDAAAHRLLAHWPWTRTPLQPDDDP